MESTTIQTPADYPERIRAELRNCLVETDLPKGTRHVGKVRDRYDLGDRLVLITTDRQSAFDRVLAAIPFKGQVLNLTSAWWFEQTRHILPNHVLGIPDPNVTLARKCEVQLAYAIGVAQPVSVRVETFGTGKADEKRIGKAIRDVFPLTPRGIIDGLDLLRPIYRKTAAYGHFGRDEPEFTWERTDRAQALRKAAGV